MKVFTQNIEINADVEKVFSAYVDKINEWWPRQGEDNRYSWPPEGVEPKDILFEAKLGGRYYERFADGSEFVIGQITEYDPPHKLSYTWQGRDWPGDSLIQVRFEASGGGTLLSLTHSGFEIFGEDADTIAEGYSMGTKEILGIFQAWYEENLVNA